MGRALDLILTGRPIGSEEALSMGLVNRVVPVGDALQRSLDMAEMLSQFPQNCLLADRRSVYEQSGLSLEDALQREFEGARRALDTESVLGATRFRDGAGRGGRMVD